MTHRKVIGPFTQAVTLASAPLAGPLSDDYLHIIPEAGIAVQNGHIIGVGNFEDLKESIYTVEEIHTPCVALPGFVDAHTHLCYAGSRAGDYTKRLQGLTYQQIAAQGGGILDTVRATRAASTEQLIALLLVRLHRQLAQGITTCEIKSGYGLTVESEMNLLHVIKAASRMQPINLVPTCLAAHVLPPEFNNRKEYLAHLIVKLLPFAKYEGLADRLDIFIDNNAFSIDEARTYLQTGLRMGFTLGIHADQFSRGGAQLAAELGACSADHLEQSTAEDFRALRDAATVAVLLPGATLGLGLPFPQARAMLDAGLCVAIASDWNPGSAPMGQLLTQASLLSAAQHLTTAETFAAITFRASAALNLKDRGRLDKHQRADIAVFSCADYRDILYNQGSLLPDRVFIKGTSICPPQKNLG